MCDVASICMVIARIYIGCPLFGVFLHYCSTDAQFGQLFITDRTEYSVPVQEVMLNVIRGHLSPVSSGNIAVSKVSK